MLVLMQQGDQSNIKDEVVSDSKSEVAIEVPMSTPAFAPASTFVPSAAVQTLQ